MSQRFSQLFEGIDILAAVIDSRSFGGAADVLNMSQSGVSRAIARLETRVGIRLLERTTRSVRLTEEGRDFYEQVMPLIHTLADITTNAASSAQVVRGRLRINVDPLFAQLVLGPRLGVFMDNYPKLEIELRSKDGLGDLVAEGFDLALRFGHPQSSSLVARKLFDTRVCAVASSSYLEHFGHPADPQDLENGHHRCIEFREPVTGRPFPWEFYQGRKKLVVKPDGALTVNDPAMLNSACIAGLGIAQLLELGIEHHLATGTLVQVFPKWSDQRFPLYAYYPSRRHLPLKTRMMLDFVASLV